MTGVTPASRAVNRGRIGLPNKAGRSETGQNDPPGSSDTAHWQLGDKDKARKHYDQAVKPMDRMRYNDPAVEPRIKYKIEERRRLRDEAAALLGIKEEPKAEQGSGVRDQEKN